MKDAIQYSRSLAHVVLIYLMMPVIGLLWLPAALRSRQGAANGCRAWANFAMWTARWMVGIKVEVRGTPPTEECLIAAKHQSFLDIIMIYNAVPHGKFVMKKELMKAPVLGWYARQINCVPVDRGKRAEAVKQMVQDVEAGRADPGQLVIYPQGTRILPGVKADYKVGSAILYRELNQPCYPVACNVGLFWPRRGIMRRPGLAVVDFLEPIQPGLEQSEFLATLEERIETRSDALAAEAGFVPLTSEPGQVQPEKDTDR